MNLSQPVSCDDLTKSELARSVLDHHFYLTSLQGDWLLSYEPPSCRNLNLALKGLCQGEKEFNSDFRSTSSLGAGGSRQLCPTGH